MSEEVIEVRPTASEAGKKVIFGIIWVLINMIKQLTDFWKTLTIWRLSIETTMGIPVWSNYASVRPSYLVLTFQLCALTPRDCQRYAFSSYRWPLLWPSPVIRGMAACLQSMLIVFDPTHPHSLRDFACTWCDHNPSGGGLVQPPK